MLASGHNMVNTHEFTARTIPVQHQAGQNASITPSRGAIGR